MNILPKKRWHVRTKENIARVRRDEAAAAEQEKERLRRVALAEQEFRTSILRKQASERRKAIGETSGDQQPQLEPGQSSAEKVISITGTSGHINFFQHLEEGERTAGPNEEYLREQREEKEKYEKSIGYLTYLGQGSREETKQKAWFESLPANRSAEATAGGSEEVNRRAKCREDPLAVVKRLTGDTKDSSDAGPSSVTVSTPRRHSRPDTATDTANTRCKSEATTTHKKRRHREEQRKHRKAKKKKRSKRKTRSRSPSHKSHKSSKKRRRRSPSPSESSSSSEGSSSAAEEEAARRIRLERLRAERLKREREERQRAERLMSQRAGGSAAEAPSAPAPTEPPLRQRYNAQFNPYLARQNYRPS
ncbi:leukocyte receptor cluster member 1 homolog [Amphibalanus amphitrite]|uniref:leukocyte receptor cluster member 1 homolog n=1 Tax=Amphibalanus amphitrite TaxID=1232801 RepID=UPI001C8FECF4|nr:leukocyte receptor cluster member 1 homolog [Amphibalanus amphitrite]XP_043228007.1 leukocyte receptor cluster member 1 homolog [Amphibalanus amphitrite]